MSFYEYIDLFGVILNALLVSFALEAVKRMLPQIKTRVLLPFVSLAFTVLYVPFSDYKIENIQQLVTHYIFTTSFSVLYYLYLGKRTVERLINGAFGSIDNSAKDVESRPLERGRRD